MHYQHKAFRAGFNSSFALHRPAEFWSVNSIRNYLAWWYAARFHLPSFYYSLLQLRSFCYNSVCCYILPCKLEGSRVYSPQSINVVKLLFLPLHISEGKTPGTCTLRNTIDVNGSNLRILLARRKKKEKNWTALYKFGFLQKFCSRTEPVKQQTHGK